MDNFTKSYSLKDLLSLIDNYLSEGLSYDQFYSDFNYFFNDSSSEGSVCGGNFFEGINERLMFAAEAPNEEERGHGYIDANEFRNWLAEYKKTNINLWDHN